MSNTEEPKGFTSPAGRLAALFGGRAQGGDVVAERGPAGWAFILFVFFGAAQLVSAVVMFFAYNWRDLSDFAKIALPQIGMALGFLLFAALPRGSLLGSIGGLAASVMIGVSMAVVGQVYQLGADPWTLFAIWAAFALPLAVIARSDAQFAVWFGVASTAYTLWAEQSLQPANLSIIPASYAALAFGVQFLRDFVASPAAGPQPNWQRWLFIAAALIPATIAAVNEAMSDHPFKDGAWGALSLALVAGGALFLYGLVRRDRPARALALFAVAIFVGAFGIRTIWRLGPDSSGDFAVAFLLSAGWVVAVTAGLAMLLRGRRSAA